MNVIPFLTWKFKIGYGVKSLSLSFSMFCTILLFLFELSPYSSRTSFSKFLWIKVVWSNFNRNVNFPSVNSCLRVCFYYSLNIWYIFRLFHNSALATKIYHLLHRCVQTIEFTYGIFIVRRRLPCSKAIRGRSIAYTGTPSCPVCWPVYQTTPPFVYGLLSHRIPASQVAS